MKREGIISEIHEHCINIEKREIFLHSYVGLVEEEPGVDYRSASQFIKNMLLLDSLTDKPITVHMFSIGGEWEPGMAMYDCIANSKSVVTVVVHGQASSMSSIIMQAADKRIMMPNSHFMCHYGSNGYEGHYLNFQAWAEYDKATLKIMIDVYADKVWESQFRKDKYPDGDIQNIKNFLLRKMKNGDWWMLPEDAVYYGFADCIWGDKKWAEWEGRQ